MVEYPLWLSSIHDLKLQFSMLLTANLHTTFYVTYLLHHVT